MSGSWPPPRWTRVGWKLDPALNRLGCERWWDGQQWTADTKQWAPPDWLEPSWNEDPGSDDIDRMRWWDGQQWTDSTRDRYAELRRVRREAAAGSELRQVTKAFILIWMFPGIMAAAWIGGEALNAAIDYLFGDGALAEPAFLVAFFAAWMGPPALAVTLDDRSRN